MDDEVVGTGNEAREIRPSNGILFRAIGQRRPRDLIFPASCGIVFLLALWHGSGIAVLFGLAALTVIPLWSWFRKSVTELRVTEFNLSANGDLVDTTTHHMQLNWTEFSGLQFSGGDEYAPIGLYARQGYWTSVCLLPHLSEEQAGEVIDAIYGRFPYLVMAAESPGLGSIFGKRTEIITLGLSKEDSQPSSDRSGANQ